MCALRQADEGFGEGNLKHAINGYLFCNMPDVSPHSLALLKYSHVFWALLCRLLRHCSDVRLCVQISTCPTCRPAAAHQAGPDGAVYADRHGHRERHAFERVPRPGDCTFTSPVVFTGLLFHQVGCSPDISARLRMQVLTYDKAHTATTLLFPSVTRTAEMVGSAPGIWQYNCDVQDHLIAGMQARLIVTR